MPNAQSLDDFRATLPSLIRLDSSLKQAPHNIFGDGTCNKVVFWVLKEKSHAAIQSGAQWITRRYGRLLKEGVQFPDLVVVDGGEGQVSSAKGAFASLGCPLPPLIGLAKREETIVFSDQREGLKLNHRSPALRLLQRLRDEAHRFANQFNADLRSRRIRESVLDDFPGLGKVRREALLVRFGSIEKVKKASENELREVDGIGPRIAGQLFVFLRDGKLEQA